MNRTGQRHESDRAIPTKMVSDPADRLLYGLILTTPMIASTSVLGEEGLQGGSSLALARRICPVTWLYHILVFVNHRTHHLVDATHALLDIHNRHLSITCVNCVAVEPNCSNFEYILSPPPTTMLNRQCDHPTSNQLSPLINLQLSPSLTSTSADHNHLNLLHLTVAHARRIVLNL